MKLLCHSGRGFQITSQWAGPLDLLAAGGTSKMSKGAAGTGSKLSWAPSGPQTIRTVLVCAGSRRSGLLLRGPGWLLREPQNFPKLGEKSFSTSIMFPPSPEVLKVFGSERRAAVDNRLQACRQKNVRTERPPEERGRRFPGEKSTKAGAGWREPRRNIHLTFQLSIKTGLVFMNMEEQQLKRRTDEKNRVHTFTHRLLGGNNHLLLRGRAAATCWWRVYLHSTAPSFCIRLSFQNKSQTDEQQRFSERNRIKTSQTNVRHLYSSVKIGQIIAPVKMSQQLPVINNPLPLHQQSANICSF